MVNRRYLGAVIPILTWRCQNESLLDQQDLELFDNIATEYELARGEYKEIASMLEMHSKEMRDLVSSDRSFLDAGKDYQELQKKRDMH